MLQETERDDTGRGGFREKRDYVRELLILYVDRFEMVIAKGYGSSLKPRPEGGPVERKNEVDDLRLWCADMGLSIRRAMTELQRNIVFARLVLRLPGSGKRGIPWCDVTRRYGVTQVEAKRQLRAAVERLWSVLDDKKLGADYKRNGYKR